MFYFYLEESNYDIIKNVTRFSKFFVCLFNFFLRKRIEISIFVLFARVIKMWKVAPTWLAQQNVEIILFWQHGHCKMDFYLFLQMLICSTSNTTLKVVMSNTRGQGKDSLKHQPPINKKLLLKVLHLVLQVYWKELKLQWMCGKSHVSSATNLNIWGTLKDIVLVK